MKSMFSKSNLVRGLATSTAALLVMSGAAHAALTFGSATVTGAALTLDSTTTGAVNVGTGASAKTVTMGNVTGATAVAINSGTGHVTLTSTGTGDIVLNGGDDITIAPADDLVANVTGLMDLNVTEGMTLDATTMSIDGTDDSNLTVTGSGKLLTLAVAGGGAQVLALNSAGTGANAIDINATGTGGGLDIDTTDGAVAITAAGGTNGDMTLVVGDDFTLTGASGSVIRIGDATAGLAYFVSTETTSADDTLTIAESGKTFFIGTAGHDLTLPTASTANGVFYRFVISAAYTTTSATIITGNTTENVIEGVVDVNSTLVDCRAEDTISFVHSAESLGDWVELRSNGTNWFLSGNGLSSGAITCTQAS